MDYIGVQVGFWFLLVSSFSCEPFEMEFVFTQMCLCVRICHVEIALWISFDQVWSSQLTGESWDMKLISLFQELKYFFQTSVCLKQSWIPQSVGMG